MTDPEIADLLDRGYRYALSLTHDSPAAEDLLQDAWSGVLASGGTWSRAYLFRAIKNKWIDGHRRGLVVDFQPLKQEVPVGANTHDLARDLDAALATLRPEEREVLYLNVVEGWTARELSERLDRPRNTVLSLIHRARIKLKDRLTVVQEVNP
jgi:RNA polymerase sigma-70 factor (ECF subfamily)